VPKEWVQETREGLARSPLPPVLSSGDSPPELRLRTQAEQLQFDDENAESWLTTTRRTWTYQWRSRSAVLKEIGKRCGLSRRTLERLCDSVPEKVSWYAATRLLQHSTQEEQSKIEEMMFKPALREAREEYETAVRRALDQTESPGDELIEIPGYDDPQFTNFWNAIAPYGATEARARLGHIRIWKNLLAIPRLLRSLSPRARERLLSTLYEAETTLVYRELLAYRAMAPLAPKPPLNEHSAAYLEEQRTTAPEPLIASPIALPPNPAVVLYRDEKARHGRSSSLR
jgi:hypothetical protein